MANQTGFTRTTNYEDILHGTDFCPHVTPEDTSKGIGFFYEKDTFGYVFTEITCQECKVEAQKAIDEEPTCCADCKQDKPRREVKRWVWYDFYAPQGDEPRMVCNDCWKLPAHQQRMKDDAEARNAEHGDDSDFTLDDLLPDD